jgi:hypothetical protein
LAQCNAAWGVHIQQTNGSSSDGRYPEHETISQFKMIAPFIFAWIKQPRHGARVRIDARQVGSLVRIASIACERKTGRIGGTAMLPRQDVFYVKANQGRCRLMKAAIFTCVPGSVPN